ncbi:MAG: energy transducer TonB [Terriglobales bacterium]
MFGENNEPQVNFDSIHPVSDAKRRLQLLFALALLISALVFVVMRNRQFWLDALNLDDMSGQAMSDTIKKTEPPLNSARAKRVSATQSPSPNAEAHASVSPDTHETVLSPLQVDVTFSSGQHKTIVARNSAIHIDLKKHSPPSSAMAPSSTVTGTETNASSSGVQVRFSGGTVEILGRPQEPVYPLPAQQANVQGSVVLQANIGEDGNVQALQVISGPAMLTAAALEAVKQWHFKPHYEAGKAVPTATRITVSFSISTQ